MILLQYVPTDQIDDLGSDNNLQQTIIRTDCCLVHWRIYGSLTLEELIRKLDYGHHITTLDANNFSWPKFWEFLKVAFQMHFHVKSFYLILLLYVATDQIDDLGSDNSLAPYSQQTIIRTDCCLVHWRIYGSLTPDEL